jgi:hypothetical protein
MFAALMFCSLAEETNFAENTVYYETRIESQKTSAPPSWVFRRCLFEQCHTGEGGGAMRIGAYHLIIEDSVFLHCTAWEGGAIYINVHDVTLVRTCCAECSAGNRGNFMEYHTQQEDTDYESTVTMDQSSAYLCGNYASKTAARGTVLSNAGHALLRGLNFTSCTTSEYGASFYIEAEGGVDAQNFLVLKCTGPTIVGVNWDDRRFVNLDYCEFYSNTAGRAVIEFFYAAAAEGGTGKKVRHCIFAGNVGSGSAFPLCVRHEGNGGLTEFSDCVFDRADETLPPMENGCASSGIIRGQATEPFERPIFLTVQCGGPPDDPAPAEATSKATEAQTIEATAEKTTEATAAKTTEATAAKTTDATVEKTTEATAAKTTEATAEKTTEATAAKTTEATAAKTTDATADPTGRKSPISTFAASPEPSTAKTPDASASSSTAGGEGVGGGNQQDKGNQDGSDSGNAGMIAGIVAGVVAVAALLIAFFILRRRRTKTEEGGEISDVEPTVGCETDGEVDHEGELTHDYCNPIFDEDKLAPAPDGFDDSADEVLLL